MGCLNVNVQAVITSPLNISLQANRHSINCSINEICLSESVGTIEVNPSSIDLNSEETSLEISVQSNTDWVIETNEPHDWLEITYDGSKSGYAHITVKKNEGIDRSIELIFKETRTYNFAITKITQLGLREIFEPEFKLKDGGTFNVLKEEELTENVLLQ